MVQTCLDNAFPIYVNREMGTDGGFVWYSKGKQGWTSTAFDNRNPINQVGPPMIPCKVGAQIFSSFDETPFEGAGLLNHPFKKETEFNFSSENIENSITTDAITYDINFTVTFYDFVNSASQINEVARYRASRQNGVWAFFQTVNFVESPIVEIPPMISDVDFNAFLVFSVSLANINGNPSPPDQGVFELSWSLEYLANYDMGKWLCCATGGKCCSKSPVMCNVTNMTYGIGSN